MTAPEGAPARAEGGADAGPADVSARGWPDVDRLRRDPSERRLRRLVAEALRESGAQEATLWSFSPDRRVLRGVVNAGAPDDQRRILESSSVATASSLIGLVGLTENAMSFGPADEYDRSIDVAVGKQTFAMAAAPVASGERVIGVLSAVRFTCDGASCFSPAELDAVEWKAFLCGLVIDQGGSGDE